MRKVQIQNMEHDASERDLVIIEQKDGKAAAHMVKPGRALLMQIEPKAFLAIGDHVPNGLLDPQQPAADPTPPPSPEDIAIQERNAAWLAAGEALGWPAPDSVVVVPPAPEPTEAELQAKDRQDRWNALGEELGYPDGSCITVSGPDGSNAAPKITAVGTYTDPTPVPKPAASKSKKAKG